MTSCTLSGWGESFLVEKVKSFFVEKYFKKEENL